MWYIELTSCADLDNELREVVDSLTDGYTLLSLGDLLQELGESDKAEKFYRRMIENDSNITDNQKGLLHYRIGILRAKKEDYYGALDNLNKAIPYFPSSTASLKKTSSTTTFIIDASVSSRRVIYFNIGMIHHRNGNLEEAEKAWKNALEEEERI